MKFVSATIWTVVVVAFYLALEGDCCSGQRDYVEPPAGYEEGWWVPDLEMCPDSWRECYRGNPGWDDDYSDDDCFTYEKQCPPGLSHATISGGGIGEWGH